MSADGLRKTPLHAAHVALGARMVDFAGWSMPVQYAGVIEEHEAVRTAAGLFDVSHMGELVFQGHHALQTLQKLVPSDVGRLTNGRALYSMLTREDGGIVDDVIIYRVDEADYLMVVNASNVDKDVAWCTKHLLPGTEMRDVSHAFALLALQGPKAAEILKPLTSLDLTKLPPFGFAEGLVGGAECIVARTGYTGEDGFELFSTAAAAPAVWDALMAEGAPRGLKPAGLAARDTLRTEAKLSLYGNDIDDTTTPLEAGLGWTVSFDKGDFLGRDALLRQKQVGVARRLVGFEMLDAGIPRHGYDLVPAEGGAPIGKVTSGTHSPTLKKPIGMGYVPAALAAVGTELGVDIRGKVRRARVCKTPFYKRPQNT